MASGYSVVRVVIEPESFRVLKNLAEAMLILDELEQPWNQELVLEAKKRLRRVRRGLVVKQTKRE